MGFIVWIVLALVIIAVLVFMAAHHTRSMLPDIELPSGEQMPRTAVQVLAGRTLAVMAFLVTVAAALVIQFGPLTWWESDPVRLTVTFLLLAALMTFLFFNLRVKSLASRGDGSFDERDGIIIGRSCAGVGGAMMVVTAAWMIGLTEAHNDTHLVPTYYLYLIFWSVVMANVLASVAGILLAYRRG